MFPAYAPADAAHVAARVSEIHPCRAMACSGNTSFSTPLVEKNVSNYSSMSDADVEKANVATLQPQSTTKEWSFMSILKCVGPGLMLGLANSNAGDLLAAAQSGAKYKFMYLPWIVLLAVPLYIGTELATRVSVVNNTPLLNMIYESFGFWVTAASILVLAVSCMGGLVMQICTFVAVGDMWGVPSVFICLVLTVLLVFIALTDNVQRMEKIGIVLGLFELAFCVSAVLAKPDADMMIQSAAVFSDTLQATHATITGALIGAVLMPWMFFYQASAVNRNKVAEEDLDEARLDIGLGTVASQLTMGSILVTFAIAMQYTVLNLDTVRFEEIPNFLVVVLPHAKFLFSMGMMGASFVASLAIALTISWAVEEVLGMSQSLQISEANHQMAAKVAFTSAVLVACMCSLTGVKAIWMIIFCDIVNSLTVLPIIMFLLYFAHTKLTPKHELVGFRKALTFLMMILMGVCGLYSALVFLYRTFGVAPEEEETVSADYLDEQLSTTRMSLKSWRYVAPKSQHNMDIRDPVVYLLAAMFCVRVLFKLFPPIVDADSRHVDVSNADKLGEDNAMIIQSDRRTGH